MRPTLPNCSKCNTPRNTTFRGNICKICRTQAHAEYVEKNKEKIQEYQKAYHANRNTIVDNTEYQKAYYEKKKETILEKRKRKLQPCSEYICKKLAKAAKRNPLKKRKDFETYVNNHDWEKDLIMHLNFDNIRDCPMEHLDIQHWIYEEKKWDYQQTVQIDKDNNPYYIHKKSYEAPDIEYGGINPKTNKPILWPT